MAEGGVWADPERARQVVDEVKSLKNWLEPYNALRKRLDEARGLPALGGAPRLQGGAAGPARGRRSGHQVGRPPDQRAVRLRYAQGGKGRAPPGAHLAVRLAIAPAHVVRVGVRLSGGGGGHRDRDRPR